MRYDGCTQAQTNKHTWRAEKGSLSWSVCVCVRECKRDREGENWKGTKKKKKYRMWWCDNCIPLWSQNVCLSMCVWQAGWAKASKLYGVPICCHLEPWQWSSSDCDLGHEIYGSPLELLYTRARFQRHTRSTRFQIHACVTSYLYIYNNISCSLFSFTYFPFIMFFQFNDVSGKPKLTIIQS